MQFFSIIGAQRSGSTWLYSMLDEHPEICMAKPVRPEPRFFMSAEEFSKGKQHYLDTYYPQQSAIIGEKSTSYIEHPEICERMLKMFPGTRLIAILRNPARRAISNYMFSLNHGLENRTLEQVFIENRPAPEFSNISVNPFDYLARGRYIEHLAPFIERMGKDRVKIAIFEDIVENVSRMQDIYQYLGCSQVHTPASYRKIVNASEKSSDTNPAVMQKLEEYYAPYNRQLQNLVDVSCWG